MPTAAPPPISDRRRKMRDQAHLHFVQFQLRDDAGQTRSENFYWRAGTGPQESLQALQSMPTAKMSASVTRRDAGGKTFLEVKLRNPSDHIAMMAHLQLRRGDSGERVLPVYYSDNYVSMIPQEGKTLTVEAATTDLQGQKPLLVLDGWNVDVTPVTSGRLRCRPQQERARCQLARDRSSYPMVQGAPEPNQGCLRVSHVRIGAEGFFAGCGLRSQGGHAQRPVRRDRCERHSLDSPDVYKSAHTANALISSP